MRVLMFSTDNKIFVDGSESQRRMIEYGDLFEELHIIIYTKATSTIRVCLSKNVWAYPTGTWLKSFYFWDAYQIGKKIIKSRITQTASAFIGVSLKAQNQRLSASTFVITAQDPFETGLVGYWLKKKFELPLQIQVHTDFLSPFFWQESFKNKIRVLVGKWLIKKANRIRAVSQKIKQSLVAEGEVVESEIDVLPIFVDVEKIKNASIKTDLHKKYPEYDFIILMASRLTREKNIELALEAFSKINPPPPVGADGGQMLNVKCLLLIVGDGPERQNLKFKIENLKLTDNVRIEPWTDDLASYYKTADVFLLTSNYEGYGRAIIEALAVGCPVISTNVGIATEFIKSGQSGIIIEQKDVAALIDALLALVAAGRRYKGILDGKIIKNKDEYLKLYKKTYAIHSSKIF